MDDRAPVLNRLAELVGDRFNWLVKLGAEVTCLPADEVQGNRGIESAVGRNWHPARLRHCDACGGTAGSRGFKLSFALTATACRIISAVWVRPGVCVSF